MTDIFDFSEEDSQEASHSSKQTFTFMQDLNPEQKNAVETTEGPVLVLSGAGTGKTRVLTTRIAYLLATGKANPWQILAVTFTNKASREMKERLDRMIGPPARSVYLGTFHSIGVKILTRHTAEAGLKANFIILDTDDQLRLIKKIMIENNVDIKQYSPTILLDIIQRWKDRGLIPASISYSEDSSFCDGRAKGFYQIYQNRLKELNAVDFGDLLLLPLELFKMHPEILKEYQEKFKYLLVDEYQDTNIAQYLLLRLLSQKTKNICCVGDDDQSIYSWRGAEVENILKFKEVYPEATIIRLERNYRSSEHILAAASALISHNASRLGKTLKVADIHQGSGEKVQVNGYWNGTQEADNIINQIESEQALGCPLSQMAILVRTSAQTRPFEDELLRRSIPYKIIGGFKFYEREEIRDVMAYLRLILNITDDLAFVRIINKPRRGIGDSTLTALEKVAKSYHISLYESIPLAELRPSVRKTLDTFIELINVAREEINQKDPVQFVQDLLENTGYLSMWRSDKSLEAEGRLENIKELYNVLDEFETIKEFIEYASLVTDADEKSTTEQLVVMTLHASKGLEFNNVFLAGWEEGLFPHSKALEEKGEDGLEEERRLAYVGLTRAKKKAFISFASNRKIYGQWEHASPSPFVDELPNDHIEMNIDNGSRFNYSKDGEFQRFESSFFKEKQTTWGNTSNYNTSIKSERIGKRVYHESFGYGTVIKESMNGLEVRFDKSGTKKVQARFLSET